ncbi:MAG: hypothetical protein ABI779_21420 [Acidobacteriota bacterium]
MTFRSLLSVTGHWLLFVCGFRQSTRSRSGEEPQTTSNRQPATKGRALIAILLLAGCAPSPVWDELTIEPSKDDDRMVVTISTTFELHARNERVRARVEAAQSAAGSNTDAWAVRFARLNSEQESVTYTRSRGALERVIRTARIGGDELQLLFSDANITADVLQGEGWRELTFYPGTSGRATREQRQRFEAELALWSQAVGRYFTAVDQLYSYLDERPQRAPYLFAALMSEKGVDGSEPVVSEDEQPLIDSVGKAMDEIAERMDYQEGHAATFAEEADLIFNPFPARVTIRPPGEVLVSEGFTSGKDALVIEPVDLYASIASLEGQWISPDPLAASLREQTPTAAELAAQPRHSKKVVSSTEVARAVAAQLARPRTYRVRWRAAV